MRVLSEPERAAIVQCYHNDLSHEEAAYVLGIPVGTVKTHVLRAKQKLKLAMAAWNPVRERQEAPRDPHGRPRARNGRIAHERIRHAGTRGRCGRLARRPARRRRARSCGRLPRGRRFHCTRDEHAAGAGGPARMAKARGHRLWGVAVVALAFALPGAAVDVAREAFRLFSAKPFTLSEVAALARGCGPRRGWSTAYYAWRRAVSAAPLLVLEREVDLDGRRYSCRRRCISTFRASPAPPGRTRPAARNG